MGDHLLADPEPLLREQREALWSVYADDAPAYVSASNAIEGNTLRYSGRHSPVFRMAYLEAPTAVRDIVGATMQRPAAAGYETGFALWSQEQAAAIREGRFGDVDIENVSEEIHSLGRTIKRELSEELAILMMHILIIEHQPEKAVAPLVGPFNLEAKAQDR